MIVMDWVLRLVLFLGCFVWLSTSCPWLKIATRERVGQFPKRWPLGEGCLSEQSELQSPLSLLSNILYKDEHEV